LKKTVALTVSTICLLAVVAGAVVLLSRTDKTPSQPPPPPLLSPVVDTSDMRSETGVLKSIVEIRRTGLVSFIVEIDSQQKWSLKKTDPDSSLVREYLVKKKEDIKVADYVNCIMTYGVRKQNIVFTVAPEIANIPQIRSIVDEIKNIGFDVHTFSEEEIAKWQFEMMPKQDRNGSFVVKMDADKTVIAWQNYDTVKTVTTYGYENIRTDKQLNEIRRLVKDIPVNKRGLCFISGNILSKMAGTRDTNEKSYTLLNKPEMYTFNSSPEQNGLKIYKAIRESSGCNEFRYEQNMSFIISKIMK
jgi:hypothetical protein